jgi:hypothetical protein
MEPKEGYCKPHYGFQSRLHMLEEPKLLANKRDVPYQSLVKVFLSDRIEQELVVKQGHDKSVQRIGHKAASR